MHKVSIGVPLRCTRGGAHCACNLWQDNLLAPPNQVFEHVFLLRMVSKRTPLGEYLCGSPTARFSTENVRSLAQPLVKLLFTSHQGRNLPRSGDPTETKPLEVHRWETPFREAGRVLARTRSSSWRGRSLTTSSRTPTSPGPTTSGASRGGDAATPRVARVRTAARVARRETQGRPFVWGKLTPSK